MTTENQDINSTTLVILSTGVIGAFYLIGKWGQFGVNPFEYISLNEILLLPIEGITRNFISTFVGLIAIFLYKPKN